MSTSLDLDPILDALATKVAARVLSAVTAPAPETRPEPVLLRTSDAAQMLGIAEQTLRNWRSHGEGPHAVQRGALVRYRPDDVREWAASEFR
ncbi:helix-turn-helix transcriptional regulator [Microbacterium sp. NPDC090281]|uniref:helix-turn-helix transcriptional regulator n=1 Tax=Microbacterium sp. NPDC090281 TaxID=3364208 RepID=UPI00380E9A98